MSLFWELVAVFWFGAVSRTSKVCLLPSKGGVGAKMRSWRHFRDKKGDDIVSVDWFTVKTEMKRIVCLLLLDLNFGSLPILFVNGG